MYNEYKPNPCLSIKEESTYIPSLATYSSFPVVRYSRILQLIWCTVYLQYVYSVVLFSLSIKFLATLLLHFDFLNKIPRTQGLVQKETPDYTITLISYIYIIFYMLQILPYLLSAALILSFGFMYTIRSIFTLLNINIQTQVQLGACLQVLTVHLGIYNFHISRSQTVS